MPTRNHGRYRRLQASRPPMKEFDVTAYQYGAFFSGFPWQLYGCGTLRIATSSDGGFSAFYAFVRRLEVTLKGCRVTYIAVPEKQWSGLGKPAIRLHFHFLMATAPRYSSKLVSSAQSIWSDCYGNAKVEEYDPACGGARYIAKLASSTDFDYIVGNLDHLQSQAGRDLFAGFQDDPLVPTHAKSMTRGKTLYFPPQHKRPRRIAPSERSGRIDR